ncbi:MAG TPA: hypothetical protein VD993_04520 [Chitinophagaceae bacterium]|nr:hypothetical protein [Chitinophagaceae bacterium]
MKKILLLPLNGLKRKFALACISWRMRLSPRYKIRTRTDGVYLGCLKLVKEGSERYDVLYSGVRMWTKRDQRDKYEYFLRKLLDNGGMQQFEIKAGDVLATVDDETLVILQRDKYGLDFYDSNGRMLPKNTDLFDRNNTVIARVNGDELNTFIKFHNQSLHEKKKWLDSVITEKLLNSRNVYDPEAIGLIQGELVPASARGLGPDYNHEHLRKFIFQENLEYAQVPIKMSGNYTEDFRRAFEAAGIDPTDPALVDFVWHHLDDIYFDKDGVANCTMQLVSNYIHKQIVAKSLSLMGEPISETIIAGRHIGSVGIWEGMYIISFK